MNSPYQQAINAGYSDEQILEHFKKKDPTIEQKYQQALNKGFTSEQIFNRLSEKYKKNQEQPPQQSNDTFFRTVSQAPLGVAEATGPGLLASGLQFLALGEMLDPNEIDALRNASEKSGIPFDEEAYRNAAQDILNYFPTISNIARIVEEKTGIPLEPKEWYQKALRLFSLGAKAIPGTTTQKLGGGAVSATTSQALQQAGMPEQFADLFGLAIGATAPNPKNVRITETKPSGMPVRGFEKLTEPTKVSQDSLNKVNMKLEKDFRTVFEQSLKDTPIEKTLENLKTNPTYKAESKQLLDEAQNVANTLDFNVPTKTLKNKIKEFSDKRTKGFALNEYDKEYLKFMRQADKEIKVKKAKPAELVEQYRKNNQSLSEYFEPGASKALNRAKKDALLDQNRAIADVIEKVDENLGSVFKQGNDRWKKIMDAEHVAEFVDDVFPSEGKVNFKKLKDFFEDPAHKFKFERALGKDNYPKLSNAVKDMLGSEMPYKMMRVAERKGLAQRLLEEVGLFMLSPKLGAAKAGWNITREAYQQFMMGLLDKPKLVKPYIRAVENLKIGKIENAIDQIQKLNQILNKSSPLDADILDLAK